MVTIFKIPKYLLISVQCDLHYPSYLQSPLPLYLQCRNDAPYLQYPMSPCSCPPPKISLPHHLPCDLHYSHLTYNTPFCISMILELTDYIYIYGAMLPCYDMILDRSDVTWV